MPIYEYRCRVCNKKSSLFFQIINEQPEAVCSHCGSRDMQRLISSFAYHKSAQSIAEELGPPPEHPTLDYYKDPRVIGRWAEKRMEEFGVEMPKEVKEQIQAAREGEVPKDLDI